MSAQDIISIVAVVGAVAAALATYLVAVRRLSGKISTTDATQLWTESRSMREDYRDQLAEANKRVASLEGRVAAVEHENVEFSRTNIDLQARIDTLERENAALRKLVEDLRDQLRKERKGD